MEHGEPLETFRQLIFEYFEAFEYEERAMVGDHLCQTPIMRECWTNGSFWYFHAINSPKGLFRVFNEYIQRLFCSEHCDMKIFDQVVAPYWKTDAAYVIEERIKEEERYKDQLRAVFDVEMATMKKTGRKQAESQAQKEKVEKEDAIRGEAKQEDAMEVHDKVGNTDH